MGNRRELDEDIAAYCGEGKERVRLTSGSGRLELLRTQELLARYLPPAPAIVLDVGGGPGVYALPLAAQGYDVHLTPWWLLQDLDDRLGDQMRREQLLAALRRIESEPSLLGLSAHLLTVGRRPLRD